MISEASQQRQLIDIDIVEGAEGISEFAEHWDDLFIRATDATPFLSRPWVSTFVEEGRIRGTPLFLLAWSGPKLVGLCTLAVRKCLIIKIAEPIGTGQGPYLGILLDPDYPEVIQYMAEAVRTRCIASLICIEDLWSGDNATNTFFAQLARKNFLVRRVFRNPCPFIRLGCSYEEYLKNTKSKKSRQKLRTKERRLCERYTVNVEYYNGCEVTAEIIHRIASIQEQSWMKRRGAATLGRPFYRKLLLAMAQAGLTKVWLMTIDDTDAAFVLALVAHKRLYYTWTAFHLEYSLSLSVGQFLTKCTIRDACQDDILSFDFEQGDAEYKRFWSTDNYSVHRAVAGRGFWGRFLSIVYVGLWKLKRIQWVRSFYRRIRRFFLVSRKNS
ncbi:MAG: GNAT family N-acetyltransferase [Planctomycetota bacterium]|jgi:CelD/BcsL family acetyltransferase involved in cellulose biosynthesis